MDQNAYSEQATQPKTHLFTVRLWQAPAGQGRNDIRGRVQHVLSGEVSYFGDWLTLQEFLVSQSAETDDPASE